MTTTFLVGVDGSEGAQKAALFAAKRARAENARLLLVHVVESSHYPMTLPDELPPPPLEHGADSEYAMEHVLKPLKKTLEAENLEIDLLVTHGHAASQLAELARERRVDQVFTGRRGRSRMASLIFGSVSNALVQSCPVPITVVPRRSLVERASGAAAGIEKERDLSRA